MYNFIYLCILKTKSSPQGPQFQSNSTGSFSVFSIYVTSFSYSETLVSYSLCHPTHGHPVHPITVTAVAKPYADVPVHQMGSEALHWTAAPTPTGQPPRLVPHNVFWIELGLEGGRRRILSW